MYSGDFHWITFYLLQTPDVRLINNRLRQDTMKSTICILIDFNVYNLKIVTHCNNTIIQINLKQLKYLLYYVWNYYL